MADKAPAPPRNKGTRQEQGGAHRRSRLRRIRGGNGSQGEQQQEQAGTQTTDGRLVGRTLFPLSPIIEFDPLPALLTYRRDDGGSRTRAPTCGQFRQIVLGGEI